jgi:hypothetical protein
VHRLLARQVHARHTRDARMSFAKKVALHGVALLAFATAVDVGLLVAVTIGGIAAGVVCIVLKVIG